MTATDTLKNFIALMDTGATGEPLPGLSRRVGLPTCEDRALAARKVLWHLTDTGYWGGPPPTREEARQAARRAWGDRVPADVAEALL